jgi:predicted phosphodiesterase
MKFFRKVLIYVVGAVLGLGILFFVAGEIDRLKSEKELGPIPSGAAPSESLKQSLKFAVMSDIHLDTEALGKALEIAKNNQVEFVIITGDLTSLGKKEELVLVKKVLDSGGLKYYTIPGNHDLWFSERMKKSLFEEVFGPEYQSFKKNNIKFILINNGSYLGLDEVQLNWIKKEAMECPEIECLVFAHMPLNNPSSVHVMGEDSPKVASQAADLVKLFVRNEVRELFAGHLHYGTEYEQDGLKTTVVGALTRQRNIQSSKFLEVWAIGEKIEKKEVYLNQ